MAEGLKFINGDWSIAKNGSVNRVTKEEKLSRDFHKMMVTDAETPQNQTSYYRYNSNYGNYINNATLFSNLSQSDKLNVVQELTYNTIQNYLKLQEERKNLDTGEVIVSIIFDTYFDLKDPRKIIIPIKITSGRGLELSETEYEQRVV